MNRIITIHGPAGAGKSTLTKILRDKLPTYSYVDRPIIKRGLKPAGRKEALRLSKEASYFLIKGLVALKQDIIVQEVTPVSMNKKIGEGFFRDNDYEVVSFYLKCSIETAIQRDQERDAKTVGEEGMHRIHKEYIVPAHHEIIIDTEKMSVEGCIDLMMSKLN